jgi:ATP-dependent Lhr-like helicase
VLEALECFGALFQSELAARAGLDAAAVESALWELVAGGHVTSDGIQSLRQLFDGRRTPGARAAASGAAWRRVGHAVQGRWALLAAPPPADPDALAEAVAEQLLARWGVLFRDLLVRETLAVSWREILWALRRLEARGAIRGGRFVTGFVGEQYALPGAVEALRRTRRLERTGETVRVCGVDPLNLVGVLTPGPRVPAVRTQQVVYRDGIPVRDAPAPSVSARGVSA